MRSLVKIKENPVSMLACKNQKKEKVKKRQKRRPCLKSCNAESIVQEKVMVNIGYHRRIA